MATNEQYSDQLDREYAQRIEREKSELESRKKSLPDFDGYKSAMPVGLLVGIAGGFLLRDAFDSWFSAFLISGISFVLLVFLLYFCVKADRLRHNNVIDAKIERQRRCLEREKKQTYAAFENDVKRRCNEIIRSYNENSAKNNPLFDWMKSQWESAILGNPAPSNIEYITRTFQFKVFSDCVDFQVVYSPDPSNRRYNAPTNSFYFSSNNMYSPARGESRYEDLVELSALARFLYKMSKYELIGDESYEGPLAYAPDQPIKSAETRASLRVCEESFGSNSTRKDDVGENFYRLCYRAKNPKFKQFVNVI